MLYLRAEGFDRQERLQYLRQIGKLSIWSEQGNELYTLPDQSNP